MSRSARLAKGAPPGDVGDNSPLPLVAVLVLVGKDISTMQPDRSVSSPAEVARDADCGRMMWTPVCSDMLMLVAAEKDGLRTAWDREDRISSL